jgi:hypothetical protein
LTLWAFVVPAGHGFAQPQKLLNCVWFGDVVMHDEKGQTVTVEAREHINRSDLRLLIEEIAQLSEEALTSARAAEVALQPSC